MQRFIPCRFLDIANIMLEITDFCPKLRFFFFCILITDFSVQRLAALLLPDFLVIVAIWDTSFNPLKTSPEYTWAGVYGKCA